MLELWLTNIITFLGLFVVQMTCSFGWQDFFLTNNLCNHWEWTLCTVQIWTFTKYSEQFQLISTEWDVLFSCQHEKFKGEGSETVCLGRLVWISLVQDCLLPVSYITTESTLPGLPLQFFYFLDFLNKTENQGSCAALLFPCLYSFPHTTTSLSTSLQSWMPMVVTKSGGVNTCCFSWGTIIAT